MFKIVYELMTEPLGLPINWFCEWIMLILIDKIAYAIAFGKVKELYGGHYISGSLMGSFFHFIIRGLCFGTIWAITYGTIKLGKYVISHKAECIIGVTIVVLLLSIFKMINWISEQNKLVKVEVKSEEGDIK